VKKEVPQPTMSAKESDRAEALRERPRHQRRPQEKFERLLAASVPVLAERGYVGASIHAITKRAGVSVGTFYGHFADKADLILHVIERSQGELARPALGDPDELTAQLRALIDSHAAGLIRAWFEAVAVEPRLRAVPLRPRVIEVYAEWVRQARAHLQRRSALDDIAAARAVIALQKEAITAISEPSEERARAFAPLIWFAVYGELPP